MASKIVKKLISTQKAPQPIARYSQAVQVDKTLYLAGQVGFDPITTEVVKGGVVAETEQALQNMSKILEAAGCTFDNVVKITIFYEGQSDYELINQVYSKYFFNSKPARSSFQAAGLPRGTKVEIDAIAVIGDVEYA